MPASFDGDALLVTLGSGETDVDVRDSLYSDWKEWMKTGTNAKYPLAFEGFGGDVETEPIQGRLFFFRNDVGWRIKPPEEDIEIQINGNLFRRDKTLPMVVPTVGAFTALVQIERSVDSQLLNPDFLTFIKFLATKDS